MKKILMTGLVMTGLMAGVSAQDSSQVFVPVHSMQEALGAAKAAHKLLFIDCYFKGCSPCAHMDREVYPNNTVRPSLERDFVPVKVDVMKEAWGDTLVRRYGLHGYPTLLVLNGDGQMVSAASGYKDPGQFLTFMAEVRKKDKDRKYLSGFVADFKDDLPDFYKQDLVEKKHLVNADAANAYIHGQKNWMEGNTGMILLVNPRLDSAIEDYLIGHVREFLARYGEGMVYEQVSRVLNRRAAGKFKAAPDDAGFQDWLKGYERYFPKDDWKNVVQVVANNYYLGIAKDMSAFLRFMSTHPVQYEFYFTATCSFMYSWHQLTPENCKLACQWAEAVMNPESSLDLLRSAADMEKKVGNEEGYKKYLTMALEKTKKYQMPEQEYYEQRLSSN